MKVNVPYCPRCGAAAFTDHQRNCDFADWVNSQQRPRRNVLDLPHCLCGARCKEPNWHCRHCHHTFAGIAAFCRHRRTVKGVRRCLVPSMIGLQPIRLPGGDCWAWETRHEP